MVIPSDSDVLVWMVYGVCLFDLFRGRKRAKKDECFDVELAFPCIPYIVDSGWCVGFKSTASQQERRGRALTTCKRFGS
jgi:hypothetical protein